MRPIYCADSQDRIPPEFFKQGKAIWSGGLPYLKENAARLGLRPDPRPPAEFAEALGFTPVPRPVPPENPVEAPNPLPVAAAKPAPAIVVKAPSTQPAPPVNVPKPAP